MVAMHLRFFLKAEPYVRFMSRSYKVRNLCFSSNFEFYGVVTVVTIGQGGQVGDCLFLDCYHKFHGRFYAFTFSAASL